MKLSSAPRWLVNACSKPKEKVITDAPSNIDQETAIERATHFLDNREPAIEGQGGDLWTYKTIAMVRDFGISQENALEVIYKWNESCEPAWHPEDLQKKVTSVYSYAQNTAGSKSAESILNDLEDIPAPIEDTETLKQLKHVSDFTVKEVWHRPYLIKHWLNQGSDAQLFGEFGQGKTFVALDLAAHIAAGQSWFDNKVTQAGVLYLLYEGADGIDLRVAALKKHYPDWNWSEIPFSILPLNAVLCDDKALDQKALPGRKQLQAAIHEFSQHYHETPKLIVIDTYSRAIGGSASDEKLAGYFASMASALRERYGATVMRIHHPGQSQKSRGRGSYAIEAGLDTVIRVSNGSIENTKQRDYGNSKVHFRLSPMQLGTDQDGECITSCIVERVENALEIKDDEQQVLDVIRKLAGDSGVVERRLVSNAVSKAGITKNDNKKVSRIYSSLEKKDYIKVDKQSKTIVLLERGGAAMFDDVSEEY